MKSILKNTWAVLNPEERKTFRVLIVLDILISMLDILSLALLLWIIQFYIQPENKAASSFLPGWLADKNSMAFIGFFLFLFALKNISAFQITRAYYRFTSRIAIRISRHNLEGYQQAGYEEFVHTDSSVHIRKIAFQPFEFCQYLLSGIQQVITQLCLIAVAITAILLFNAKLFLLLLIILLPPVVLVLYRVKNRLAAAKKNIRTENERSFQYLLDALKAYVEGNVFNRNSFFLQRFIRARQKFSASLFESISLQSLPGRIIEIFAVLGLFVLIAIVKWTNVNDSNTLLTIGAFMAAAYRVIPGIVKLINIAGQMKAYEFSICDLLQPRRQNREQENDRATPIHSVQLKNICFSYAGQQVLHDVSLFAQQGDLVGISGASGKGKTTLINILLGLLAPNKGQLLFNNTSVLNGEIKKYWPAISYVKQQSFLIHDTIGRNITLEENGGLENELELALNVSGLDELLHLFPENIDKIITENGKNISGGQQQRIAIARAIYKKADMILLDEPFNELDECSETKIFRHLKTMAGKGKIVLLVTHNKKVLSCCDKIITLDEPA